MKRIVVAVLLLTGACAFAQRVLTPPSPALTPSTPLTPGGPALAQDFAPPPTNGAVMVTNLTVADLSSLLGELQGAIQQTLPAVAAFNDSSIATDAAGPGNLAANFSQNLGQNFSQNLGQNLAANMATPTAPGLFPAPGSPSSTARAMIVLQNDLEQILPLLDGLNGGTNGVAAALSPGFVPGSLTNVFR